MARRRIWTIAIGALVLFVGFPLVTVSGALRNARRSLASAEADLDRRAHALRSVRIRGGGAPGNGWPRFAKALSDIKDVSDAEAPKFPRLRGANPRPVADPAALEPVLARLAPMLRDLESSLSSDEFESGRTLMRPDVEGACQVTRLADVLADAAGLRRFQQREVEAIAFLGLGWRAAAAAATKGMAIDRLTAITAVALLEEEFRALLESDRMMAKDLESLARMWDAARFWTEDPVLAWEPEWIHRRAWMLALARLGPGPDMRPGLRFLYSSQVMAAAAIHQLEEYERVVAEAERGPALKREAHLVQAGERMGRRANPMTADMLAALGRFHRQLAADRVWRDLARIAIGARWHLLETGSWPDGAASLVPAFLPKVLIDPYSGGPYRMSGKGSEFTVYSFGGDGDDDGGRSVFEPTEAAAADDGDFAWTLRLK